MPGKSSPEGAVAKSLEQVEGNVNAGMPSVVHVIAALNVLDINVVVVAPACWPWFIISEPIAAVLEALIPVVHPGTAHAERVAVTKIGPVTVIRNATIMVAIVPVAVEAVAAPVVSSALSLLPAALTLLCVLAPLPLLSVLAALCLLGVLTAL